MKTINDSDLGIECDHVAQGDTDDEVVASATEHIQTEHPEEWDRVKGMLEINIRSG